jgi:hypothetical protein
MWDESADVQQLNIENKRGTWGDRWRGTSGSVAEVGGNDELATPADFHAGYTLIPPCNDLSRSQGEAERLIAVSAAIELLPVRQPSGVVHGHGAVGGRFRSLALGDVLIAKAGRRLGQRGSVYLERRAEPSGLGGFVAVSCAPTCEGASQNEEDKKTVQEDLLRCWVWT